MSIPPRVNVYHVIVDGYVSKLAMSGFASIFGGQGRVDSSEFRYDPHRQKKPAVAQPSPFPFQAQVYLFKLDSSTNENKSLGSVVFLIRPIPPSYQILIYSDQNNPFVSLQISSGIAFVLRNKVYGYLTDSQGIQWTVQFSDAAVAARAAVSIAAIATQADGTKLAFLDVCVGTGPVVSMEDQVVVSYIGFLGNQLPHTQGQFDANESFTFVIGAPTIIKGYSAGVDGMRVDGSRAIIVPPGLGYGANGMRGAIPPNAVLTFLITLKSANIKPKASQPAAPQVAAQPTPKAAQPAAQTVARPAPPLAQTAPQSVATPAPQTVSEPAKPQKRGRSGSTSGQGQKESREMATVDQAELIQRFDALTEIIRTQFASLAVTSPVTMKPGDVAYEVQALTAEIEDKEKRLRQQQQVIDELKRTKQNSRLRAELDIAQSELQSLRAMLKGGRDFRRENDELRSELLQLREGKLIDLNRTLSDLRIQLVRQKELSQQTAIRKGKEMFYSFMGAAVEQLNKRFAGQTVIPTRDITGTLYDVFHQCSEDVMKQIEEHGLV
jgi:hypothetical protein